jgi:hypothetical protein
MKIQAVIITLTEKEIAYQNETIVKYTALLNKELRFGHLMNLDNVNRYAAQIKLSHDLINNGVCFDDEFMIEQSAGNPNANFIFA